MFSWIFLTNAIIVISAKESSDVALRNKRQLSFGFGVPTVQDSQAIGGLVNSFLGGFFGQNPQNGARPFEGHGGHGGGDHGHFTNGDNRGCNLNNGGCHHGCRFGRGRVNCFCNPGYFLNEDGRTCSDIDECRNQFNRPCQDTCTNTEGSFVCGCSNGGTVLPDGSCGNGQFGISCAQNNGGCQQYCRDRRRRGGVRCRCDDGYEIGPDRRSCLDVDECASGFHDCGPLACTNTVGSYSCGSAAHTVAPVIPDPCKINNGGCQHICINNHGTIQCQCPAEFQLVNGKLCQRVVVLPVDQPTTPIPIPSVTPPVTTASPPAITTALLPQLKDCGSNNKKSLFRRIVGGKPSDPKDWPWMAALLRSGNQQFCGGTLISNQHVLTAAHCVHTFTSNNLKVRLGEYSFTGTDDNNPTDFKVNEIRKHESYDTTTQENDIAILKLERPTTFSEFISPACLPPPANNFEDLPGYVIGWGTIHFGGPVSNVLQEVVIPTWKQEDCVKAYPDNKVTDGMMCCGQKAGGKDSCQGDSGGPFLIQIFPDNRWYVAGIVSWGIECASPDRPGVYTRVNRYLDWIKSNAI